MVVGGDCIGGRSPSPAALNKDDKTAEAILARCVAVEPRLTQARVLGHLIGLRPIRDRVRVEADQLQDGTALLHNYGHGGAGVTLSWGCAHEIRRLIG
jgi:D-amino-acid oxidase